MDVLSRGMEEQFKQIILISYGHVYRKRCHVSAVTTYKSLEHVLSKGVSLDNQLGMMVRTCLEKLIFYNFRISLT